MDREPPVLIWDGDCDFCRCCVRFLDRTARNPIEMIPYQQSGWQRRFPHITLEQCERAVQYIDPGGRTCEAAAAVYQSLRESPFGWLHSAYERSPLFAWFSERGYAWVARNRGWFSKLARLLTASV